MKPTAILCHGGIPVERAPKAIELWGQNQTSLLVFTGVVNDWQLPYVRGLCSAAKVPPSQLIIDAFSAAGPWDTVTEITMTIPWIRKYGASHVILVSSDWHLPRCSAIAKVAYTFNGLTFETVATRSKPAHRTAREDSRYIAGDVQRTMVWRFSGRVPNGEQTRRERPVGWNGT